MSRIHNILIYTFALVIFTGTIGIHKFVHFCLVDGVDYSYVIPQEHTCKPVEEEKSCCHNESASEDEHHDETADDHCCKEDVRSFKIASDFIQKAPSSLDWTCIVPATTPTFWSYITPTKTNKIRSGFISRPPPKSGREILIDHQVFRI